MKKTFTLEVEYEVQNHVGKDIIDELAIISLIEKGLDKYVAANYLKGYSNVDAIEE